VQEVQLQLQAPDNIDSAINLASPATSPTPSAVMNSSGAIVLPGTTQDGGTAVGVPAVLNPGLDVGWLEAEINPVTALQLQQQQQEQQQQVPDASNSIDALARIQALLDPNEIVIPADDGTNNHTTAATTDTRDEIAVPASMENIFAPSNAAHEESDSDDDDDHAHIQISADDLMPALAYVLTHTNPPNIDNVLWLCAEFRHTEMFHGEESFCVSQIQSAVEFCRFVSQVV
jgi:hypothetical protein